jgi:hypothetical protein
MKPPYTENVSSKYGAPMGRRNNTQGEPTNLHLRRVPFVDGDYDPGGAYWGGGQPLYCAWNDDFCVFRRATSRDAAKAAITEEFVDVSFKR